MASSPRGEAAALARLLRVSLTPPPAGAGLVHVADLAAVRAWMRAGRRRVGARRPPTAHQSTLRSWPPSAVTRGRRRR